MLLVRQHFYVRMSVVRVKCCVCVESVVGDLPIASPAVVPPRCACCASGLVCAARFVLVVIVECHRCVVVCVVDIVALSFAISCAVVVAGCVKECSCLV